MFSTPFRFLPLFLVPLCPAEVIISEIKGASSDRLLRYDESGQAILGPGTPWFQLSFDDSAWQTGRGPFGFGQAGVRTDLSAKLQGKAPSFYLRQTFELSAAQAASSEQLQLVTEYDDGIVVWINGREVARCHMGPPGMFVYSDQIAFNGGSTVGEPEVLSLGRASDLLQEGENVIAIQVGNHTLASPLFFGGSLRLGSEGSLVEVRAEDFGEANGAFVIHRNVGGVVTGNASGTPVSGGWLDRSPPVESGAGWQDLEVRTLSDAGAGEQGDGAVAYTVTGSGPLAPAMIPFPSVDMGPRWSAGGVSAATLAATRVSFRFKADPDTAFDFGVRSPDGEVVASGFPMVRAQSDDTLGYWRFEEEGVSAGQTITRARDESGNERDAGPSGNGSGTFSNDVPGAVIFDPLANRTLENRFSMNAGLSGRRMSVPNDPAFDVSFTAEMFIKIDGEPNGYTPFLRRQSSGSTRWQIDFDHANSGPFGRLRARIDTEDGENTNFVVGPLGGASVPSSQRIWVDTDAGDGLVSSYNDPTDWSRDGDARNDRPGWHHVALTVDEVSGEVRFYYDHELIQTRSLSDSSNSGYAHPASFIEFGNFGSGFDLLLDEVRYTGRVLESDEFLRVVANDPDIWSTYEVYLGQGDLAERAALVEHLNARGQTSFTPVLKIREDSYSEDGRTLVLDSFEVRFAEGLAQSTLVAEGEEWRYFEGVAEPSGGVHEPAVPGVERADFVDWIELSNTGGEAVDLTGWSLSDDPLDWRKWSFPAGTSIPAGGHLLVLADDLDTSGFVPEFLHANFKLSRGGEFLVLVDAGGQLRSGFPGGFPRQFDFYSYGLRADGPGFAYLAEPTPGRENDGPAYGGIVGRPDFSVPGGFHSGPVTLAISSATPGALIRYTTDGSEPTLDHGSRYSGPIVLGRLGSRTAHSIRARAFFEGWIPSTVKSATYLIGQSANLTSAPALVMTGEAGRSFTRPYGVLTIDGGNYVNALWEPDGKDAYNMVLNRGRAFERPAFIEFYAANSTVGFREEGGLRVAASNFTRPRFILDGIEESPWISHPRDKPSFNLYFRGDYGDPSVSFPMFGPDYPVDTFEQLRVRAGKNDMNNPHLKDEVMRRLLIDMGNVGSRGIFNSLYVNGEWKGFYNTCERLREPFFQAHYPNSGEWDILQAGNPNRDLAEGDHEAWDELNARLQVANVNSEASWNSALELVDPVAMADYFLLNIYGATWDWPHNNWVSARERSPEGRFRFYVWDAEGAFGHPWNSRNRRSEKPKSYNVISRDLLSGDNSTSLMFQRLHRWPEFRLIMADRIQRHFFNGGSLDDSSPAESRVKEVIDTAIAEFSPLLNEGFGETVDLAFWNNWTAAGSSRRSYLLGPNGQHFRSAGYWPQTEPPSYNRHGGEVSPGFVLTMSSGSGTIYYTTDGSDPRRFGGVVSPGAVRYDSPIVLPAGAVTVKSRLRSAGGEWSALTEAEFKVGLVAPSAANLVVAEIHYHPGAPSAAEQAAGFVDQDDFEFIRLENIGDEPLDLSGLVFRDGVDFSFANGLVSSLAPGGAVLVVRNLAAFRFRYGPAYDDLLAGQYGGGLSNSGERLRLEGPGGVIRDFSYDDLPPWPASSDGGGVSLVLRAPGSNPDHALAASWTASAQFGGLPGGEAWPLDYAVWRAYLLGGTLATGPNDDPDGDGLTNLVEFYLGGLPGVSDARLHAPVTYLADEAGETHQFFRFTAVSSSAAPVGRVEVSPDLEDWSSGPGVVAELLPAVDNGNGSVTRTFRVVTPVAEAAHSYLRLRVTEE